MARKERWNARMMPPRPARFSLFPAAGVMLLLWGLGTGCRPDPQEVLARVGSREITRAMLDYRLAAERCYGFDSIQPWMGMAYLVRDAWELEAADSLGVRISADDLAEYRSFVQRTTRDPDRLKAIQKVFGADSAAFDTLYLRPLLVNARNREAWYAAASFHLQEHDLALRSHNLTLIREDFRDIARMTGTAFEEQRLAPGPAPAEQPPAVSENPVFHESPFLAVASALQDGQVCPDILDTGTGYAVLKRRDAEQGGIVRIQLLTVPKRSFDDFLEEVKRLHPALFLSGEWEEDMHAHGY